MRRSSQFPLHSALMIMVAATVLASPSTAKAQLGPSEDNGQPRESTTFSFPGGTLKEFVELINQQFGVHVDVAPEVEDLIIEPVQLKESQLGGELTGASLLQVLEALAPMSLRVDKTLYDGETMHYRISAKYNTRVFSVRSFINNGTGEPQEDAMKALISAIEAALDLGSSSVPKVKMKIHPDTGLLLVAGTHQQVEIIEEVASQVNEGQRVPRETVEDLYARIETLEKELENLRMKLEQQP